MVVWLNGEFVPEEAALISVFDRGFLYGDGLFEAIRLYAGKPFRTHQHLERLFRGAAFLGINVPLEISRFEALIHELAKRNSLAEGVLRISLSRGVGPRGYSPREANNPTLVLSLHPLAEAMQLDQKLCWNVVCAPFHVATDDPLANHKTANKLPQVLARAHADEQEANETLVFNANGWLTEASSSNVFWIKDARVHTPPLNVGALPGVTRAIVAELCHAHDIPMVEAEISREACLALDGMFLTLTTIGVVEVCSVDRFLLPRSPLTGTLRKAYAELVRSELKL